MEISIALADATKSLEVYLLATPLVNYSSDDPLLKPKKSVMNERA